MKEWWRKMKVYDLFFSTNITAVLPHHTISHHLSYAARSDCAQRSPLGENVQQISMVSIASAQAHKKLRCLTVNHHSWIQISVDTQSNLANSPRHHLNCLNATKCNVALWNLFPCNLKNRFEANALGGFWDKRWLSSFYRPLQRHAIKTETIVTEVSTCF